MKNVCLIVFLFVFSSFLFGQTDPQLSKVGLTNTSGGGGDGSIEAGQTVYVRAESNGSGGTIQSGIHNNGSSQNNKLYVYYYSDSPPSTYQTYKELTATSFSVNSNVLTYQFDLPAEDSNTNGAQSIEIYFGLIGQQAVPPPPTTNFGTAELSYSSVNDAPTNYSSYLTYESDTETESPTLDSPIDNSTITSIHTIQYDQPEEATDSSAKIIYTRTAGSADSGSPHTLIVESESSGSNKTLSINGANLGGSSGIASVDGGNALVQGAEYTIQISYEDLAGNTAATDEAYGIIWATCSVAGEGSSVGSGSLNPGGTDQVFFRVDLWYTGSGDPDLTSITFRPGDNNTTVGSDFESNGFTLWSSSDDNQFNSGSDTELGSASYSSAITFSGISVAIPRLSSKAKTYLFLTADVTSDANTSHTLQINVDSRSDITVDDGYMDASNFPLDSGEQPLPVVLSQLQVQMEAGYPIIQWTTQSEINNAGWNIYRSISKNFGQASKLNVNMIEGQGTKFEPTLYHFQDFIAYNAGFTYYYWIEAVDLSGNTDLYGPLEIETPTADNQESPYVPEMYGLFPNYPNPFNPSTSIRFKLQEDANGEVSIFNAKGQLIKTIFKGDMPKEQVLRTVWDGTDKYGRTVPSGVYFCHLKSNRHSYAQRLILSK